MKYLVVALLVVFTVPSARAQSYLSCVNAKSWCLSTKQPLAEKTPRENIEILLRKAKEDVRIYSWFLRELKRD